MRAYYISQAARNRIASRLSELSLIALSAAVAIVGVLNPNDARIPAILGALAVTVSGLRATFHWRDNWIRFTMARMTLRGQIRLYECDIEPFDDPATKSQRLVRMINDIEMKDSSSWAAMDSDAGAKITLPGGEDGAAKKPARI